jgi:hypothetical protein
MSKLDGRRSTSEVPVKYLILVYTNPRSREIWARLTDAQREQGLGGHAELVAELAGAGTLVTSGALDGPSTGRRVSRREGRPVSTDGPYAEVKEQLAGFYLIEAADLDEAMEWAAKVPEAEHVDVEVRPVLDHIPDGPRM